MDTTLFLIMIIVAVAILLRSLFYIAIVEGDSMRPNFVEGQQVLVIRWWPYKCLRKGNVIATSIGNTSWIAENQIKYDVNGVYIKRVIGLSGDEITTNLFDLPEIYRSKLFRFFNKNNMRVWKVPPNHYFIKSDYIGLDSTLLGPVSSEEFKGLVLGKLPRD
jgi:signal peptidase I